jgi:hypothetical protein
MVGCTGLPQKGVGIVTFRLPLWLVCLVLAVLTVGCGPGRSSAPASIASVTLTDQVDEVSRAPVRSVTAYPAGAKVMFVSALVKSPQKGTKVEAQWFYDKEGKGTFVPVASSPVTFEEASRDKYVAFKLEATETFPAGAYKVQVSLDGKMAKEIAFKVE